MARRRLILVLATGAAAALVVAAVAWMAFRALDERVNDRPIAGLDTPRIVVVKPGSSLAGVASMLAREGLLEQPDAWVRLARREDVASRLRAGEYELQPGSTPRQLLAQMVAGRVLLHSITIPEGWTFRARPRGRRRRGARRRKPDAGHRGRGRRIRRREPDSNRIR